MHTHILYVYNIGTYFNIFIRRSKIIQYPIVNNVIKIILKKKGSTAMNISLTTSVNCIILYILSETIYIYIYITHGETILHVHKGPTRNTYRYVHYILII